MTRMFPSDKVEYLDLPELAIGLDPQNYLHPEWPKYDEKLVHDWRGYVHPPLRAAWSSFSDVQKLLVAANAQVIANDEVWE